MAERARVLSGGEGNQRGAEAIGLPVGLLLTPVARVASEAEEDFVMAPVLGELVGIGVCYGTQFQMRLSKAEWRICQRRESDRLLMEQRFRLRRVRVLE